VTARLVGRQRELSLLGDRLAAAEAGMGSVVVLEGAAGIGKSRLLEEASGLAAQRQFVVAAARSDELDQLTPLAPLIAALRTGDRPVLNTTDVEALGAARHRLWILERLRAILEAESRRRPVLVSIDDIQWADGATLHALATLPGQLFAVPVLWLVARRPTPMTAVMEVALGRLAELGASRLRIEPLAPEATAALVADRLGVAADPTLTALLDQAGGNPFYVLELLQGLVETGRIRAHRGRARVLPGELPDAIRSAVATHIRALPRPSRELVAVASVLGREFDVADLAAVMDEPPARLVGAVADAVAAEVFVERDERLAFRHDLLREAVYLTLPGATRRALHDEAVAALRKRGAPASHLASHVSRSARPGDDDAIALLTDAARSLAPTNPAGAAGLAVEALELLPRGDRRRAAAGTYAVELLGQAGRLDDAVATAQTILSEGPVEPAQQAAMHLGIRRSWVMTSRQPIALTIPPAVLDADTVTAGIRAMLLALEASGLSHSDLTRAERLAEQARRESSRFGGADAAMLTAAVSAGVAFGRGELNSALELALEADGLRSRGSAASQSFPQWFVGFGLCPLDRLREADARFTSAYRAAEHAGSAFEMSLAEASRAAALLAAGRLDDAASAAESAVDTAAPLELGQPLGEALRVLAEVKIRRGDLAAAKAIVRALEPLLARGSATATASWAAALLADAQGHPRRGIASLAEAIALLATGNYRLGIPDPPQLPRLAGLALDAGDGATAALAVKAAEHLAATNGDRPNLAGAAKHARGLLEDDEAMVSRAVELLQMGERPLATAAAQESLGALLAEHSRVDDAIAVLTAAHATYASYGAGHDAARLRGRLRRLGVRIRRPAVPHPTQGWESLTPQELSVCRAVAEGLSSHDVALRLYLSINTVNTHLRHAFTKLGVRSRVELTRLAISHAVDE
jgi:DNA-binding NarL/FixJ family response regulator